MLLPGEVLELRNPRVFVIVRIVDGIRVTAMNKRSAHSIR
ncbi:hypothetical protein OKW43_007397 [Paraburkholderia sp. WC7.3g]